MTATASHVRDDGDGDGGDDDDDDDDDVDEVEMLLPLPPPPLLLRQSTSPSLLCVEPAPPYPPIVKILPSTHTLLCPHLCDV